MENTSKNSVEICTNHNTTPAGRQQHANGKPRRFHSEHHQIRKRPTVKPVQRKNDVYITNKSNFNVSIVYDFVFY